MMIERGYYPVNAMMRAIFQEINPHVLAITVFALILAFVVTRGYMISMTLSALLLLYVCFRLKQFAGDFLLQTDWMALTKGKPGREGLRALFSHTVHHAVGTTLITLAFAPSLWWLGLVDFAVHSAVDRIKGIITYKKGWKYTDRWFWWSFGFDQEAHNFTHLAYIIAIVFHSGGIILPS